MTDDEMIEFVAQIVRYELSSNGTLQRSADPGLTIARAILTALRLRGLLVEDWQPIETAPKDGTVILVAGGADDNLDYVTKNQHALLTAPCRVQWHQDGWLIGLAEAGFVGIYRDNPTHWRPLPAAPTGGKS